MWNLSAIVWTIWMYIAQKWGERLASRWKEGMPTNCILWALTMKHRQGGRLEFLDSKHGSWFHCYYLTEEGEEFEFNPDREKAKFFMLKFRIPPPIFWGKGRKVKDEK